MLRLLLYFNFFLFFPPDFLESPLLLDFFSDLLLDDFLLEADFALSFLLEPFLPFFGFSAAGLLPPPPLGAEGGATAGGGGGGLEMVRVATCRPW